MSFTPEQIKAMAEEARRRMAAGLPVNAPPPEPDIQLRPEMLERDWGDVEAAKARARAATEEVRENFRRRRRPGGRVPDLRPRPRPAAQVEPPPTVKGDALDAAAEALADGKACLLCRGPAPGQSPVCEFCIRARVEKREGYGAK